MSEPLFNKVAGGPPDDLRTTASITEHLRTTASISLEKKNHVLAANYFAKKIFVKSFD